jgi:hypothetical protein
MTCGFFEWCPPIALKGTLSSGSFQTYAQKSWRNTGVGWALAFAAQGTQESAPKGHSMGEQQARVFRGLDAEVRPAAAWQGPTAGLCSESLH